MHETEQGNDLRALQRGVQRGLGQCLLGLQDYERLLKAFLARHQLSASVDTIENAKAERIATFERQTLGALVISPDCQSISSSVMVATSPARNPSLASIMRMA